MLHVKNKKSISGGALKNSRKHLATFGAAGSNQEQAKSLLINSKLSDIKFVVLLSLHECTTEKSKKMVIPTHRFLLVILILVFYTMSCHILAESNDHIDIADCD